MSQPDSICGINRRSNERLCGQQAHIAARQHQHHLHVLAPRGAGIEIRRQRQCAAPVDQRAAGAVLAEGEAKGRAGERDANRVRLCEQRDVLGRRGDDVICGDRAQLNCEGCAAERLELVHMDLERKAQLLCGFEDASRLGEVERALLTEHIAEDGPTRWEAVPNLLPCRPRGGQHLLDEEVDVVICAAAILGRDRVRAEEGRDEVERALPLQQRDGLQLLELIRHVQPVAGLGFRGGRAVGQHAGGAGCGLVDQLRQRRRAGVAHRANDATAGRHNFHVRCAADAQLELARAVSHPRQVRVRVDEAGDDCASARVQRPRGFGLSHKLVFCADGDDVALCNCHCAAGNNPQLAHLRAAPRSR